MRYILLHRLLGLAMMKLFEGDKGDCTEGLNDTEITDSSEENEDLSDPGNTDGSEDLRNTENEDDYEEDM